MTRQSGLGLRLAGVLACLVAGALAFHGDGLAADPPSAPPFSGTVFVDPDVITASDPSSFSGLVYKGQGERTMYDRRVEGWVTLNAYLFEVSFSTGYTIEAQVNPEFGSALAAEAEVLKYSTAIGRIPAFLLEDVETSWIHMGVHPFGGGNNNLLIHTGQGEQYIAGGYLEEVFVHEAAHTTLDAEHAASTGWLAAQQADADFISDYARDNPAQEDVAESYLMHLAVRVRPERLAPSAVAAIEQTIPHRLAYFDQQAFAPIFPATPGDLVPRTIVPFISREP